MKMNQGYAKFYVLLCIIDLGKIEALFFLIYSVFNIAITIYIYKKTGKEYKSIWIFGVFAYLSTTLLVLRVKYINGEFNLTFLISSIIIAVIVFIPCLIVGIKSYKSSKSKEKLICIPLLGLLGGFAIRKVEVLNVVNEKISKQRLMVLKPKINIILIYDIDVENTEILNYNIEMLKKYNFKNIYHIQSINNFEDELVFSTSLKRINDMYNTVSVDEFKTKFVHQNDLLSKLKRINYDNSKMWSRVNNREPFKKYSRKEDLAIIKNKMCYLQFLAF